MNIPFFRRVLPICLLAGVALLGMTSQVQAQAAKELPLMTLSGTDANGKKLELSDYAGNTLLVSFFTAGCNLCARDLRLMREFYVGNAKRHFVLLAINIDRSKQDYETYLQLINLAVPKEQRFPIIWRHAPGFKDNFGNIISQPTHFVISPKGQLLWKREGTFQSEDWDNLWEALG